MNARCQTCRCLIDFNTDYEELERIGNKRQFLCEPCVDNLLGSTRTGAKDVVKQTRASAGISGIHVPLTRERDSHPQMHGSTRIGKANLGRTRKVG